MPEALADAVTDPRRRCDSESLGIIVFEGFFRNMYAKGSRVGNQLVNHPHNVHPLLGT